MKRITRTLLVIPFSLAAALTFSACPENLPYYCEVGQEGECFENYECVKEDVYVPVADINVGKSKEALDGHGKDIGVCRMRCDKDQNKNAVCTKGFKCLPYAGNDDIKYCYEDDGSTDDTTKNSK